MATIPTLTNENSRILAWSVSVGQAIQDESQRIDALALSIVDLQAELGDLQTEAPRRYPSLYATTSTNVTLLPGSLHLWHYINVSGSRNVTLPANPAIGDWVAFVNTGTGTLNIRDSGTIVSLSQNEMCVIEAFGDTSGRGTWPGGAARVKSDGTIVYAGLTVTSLTQPRVVFVGTGGLLTDSSNFTYTTGTGQLTLATTGSGAGILIGGDTQLYRSAADTLLTPDRFQISAPTNTTTSGNAYGLLLSHTGTPASASSGRTFGLSFTATAGGNQNFTDATAGITGLEGSVMHTGSGTVTGAIAAIFFGSSSSTGRITQMTHNYALGWDVSSGARIDTWNGFRCDGPRASGAGQVDLAYWYRCEPRTVSTGFVTDIRGFAAFPNGNMNAFSANGQTRIAFDAGAMPDPGAFTTPIVAAIRIQGTNRTRDRILFSGNGAYIGPHTNGITITQPTAGNEVFRLESNATNDDPTEVVFQNRVATTDATTTTIATIAIPASTTVMIEARVVARRTGGASGTAEDGAGYIVTAVYKNVAGTATEIGETSVVSSEDQAAWAVAFTPSGSNALIQVTGAASNNVTWHVTYRTYSVSS